ncbi:MAG: SDR family NAD(P)-dependent oxidoreductase [Sphingomonadales bacterium]|nr:MAG: SDR family NAD(P)-dependent oxidoreductase [Sphingomonadales bacterium]TNF03737.1 MAG: SDR family NAD(P)-dependent oxidoreductase [Sphingomonadales bacterium]
MYGKDQVKIDLKNRVAIVTGAGGGLGRAHALLLAARGAKVLVNDLGAARTGDGGSLTAAQAVVEEICALGGEAIANGSSVTDFDQVEDMVAQAIDHWGHVDILVNNAGILRDKTFAKVSLEDFKAVVDVHFWGSVHCTKAVWNRMRDRNYGRIVMTTSSSGLYGNFGQSAYGAAKLAVVGLMNTLHLEGEKYNIRVNALAPSAATRMTEDIMSAQVLDMLSPGSVSPGVLALVSENAPSRMIMCAGAGSFEAAHITLTEGYFAGAGAEAAEHVAANLNRITNRDAEMVPANGMMQSQHEFQVLERSLARA